jgi:hypothetical protein
MQDFESIALGLQSPAPKATLQRNDHLVLSHAERAVVATLPNSSAYNVILRIMEGEIEKLETLHMLSWRNKEEFERTGLIAVAARSFYTQLQNEINYHSIEFSGEQQAIQIEKAVEEMTPEEFMRKGFGLDEE